MEVLLTQRAYWNTQAQRPFLFPGEWVFPGGQCEEGEDLCVTAQREFREELLYAGEFHDVTYLREGSVHLHGTLYAQNFYSARIDSHPTLQIGDEIIRYAWMRPTDAIAYITSSEVTHTLEKEYAIQRLSNPRYGVRSIAKRTLPEQTIATLAYLANNQKSAKRSRR